MRSRCDAVADKSEAHHERHRARPTAPSAQRRLSGVTAALCQQGSATVRGSGVDEPATKWTTDERSAHSRSGAAAGRKWNRERKEKEKEKRKNTKKKLVCLSFSWAHPQSYDLVINSTGVSSPLLSAGRVFMFVSLFVWPRVCRAGERTAARGWLFGSLGLQPPLSDRAPLIHHHRTLACWFKRQAK